MKHYELKYEFENLRFLGRNEDLSLGYFYDVQNKKIIEFDISKNKQMLKHFLKLVNYVGMPSRRDKYLGTYKIFELLNNNPKLEWRAVRVSISHSKRKITEKKVVDFLLANFGELEISFEHHHQSAIFYKIFTELVEATYYEILAHLDDVSYMKNENAQNVISILEQHKDAIKTKTIRSYQYLDFHENLEKYIPNHWGRKMVKNNI